MNQSLRDGHRGWNPNVRESVELRLPSAMLRHAPRFDFTDSTVTLVACAVLTRGNGGVAFPAQVVAGWSNFDVDVACLWAGNLCVVDRRVVVVGKSSDAT